MNAMKKKKRGNKTKISLRDEKLYMNSGINKSFWTYKFMTDYMVVLLTVISNFGIPICGCFLIL